MAISLADQYTFAMIDASFRHRIAAALTSTAITAFSAPFNTNTTTQGNRIQLASQILADPARHVTAFAWIVVTQSSANTGDALTDDVIKSQITSAFDPAANQLVGAS